VPDTAKLLTCLIDLAFEAQLISKPVQQIYAAEARADYQDIGLEIVNVGVSCLCVGLVGVSSPNICT